MINITGLSIGLACVILIALFVQDEKGYDKFFSRADRIYQVDLDITMSGQSAYVSNTPPPVGAALQRSFPEIETYTRFFVMGSEVISTDGDINQQKRFTEKNFLAVDSNFLQVFDFPFVEGNPVTCFVKPHSIVVTETLARKYFGNTGAIGKNLLLDEYSEPFVVTGILKDIPKQSTVQFDLLIPTSACPPVKRFSWSWVWLQMNTYVVLNRNFSPSKENIAKLESKFPDMVKTQAASAFERIGQPMDEFLKKGGKWDFHLQPLTRVHLYSDGISTPFLTTVSDIKYVYIFSAIALFIMILACVNFMNLSTAQSATRAKEVGIRKVLGSARSQLIRQFLTEAFLYTFLSTLIALLLVSILLPLFNNIAGKSLSFQSIFSSGIWIFIIILMVVTSILAGSYPAFYLTSFNPVSVLKGGVFKKSISSLFIRNGLVVFQFTVSIALIICTVIVFQQLRYSQKMDLGLQKDNVIIIPNAEKMDKGAAETMRQEVAKLQGVQQVSISTSVPTRKSFEDMYVPEATATDIPATKDIALNSFLVDESFVPALAIKVVKGRNFSTQFNDSASVIINETAAQQIGWKDPLGKFIIYPGNGNRRYQVIGVTRDYNVQSIRDTVVPFVLFHTTSKSYRAMTSFILVKTNGNNTPHTLAKLAAEWKQLAPALPFEYSFLDKNFETLYQAEQKLGSVFGVFTGLSIVVACLGLFGLSMYTAERRNKEIGIRKVLGASVQNIVGLLSKEFVKLVCLSIVLAFPLGWWAMNTWLRDFAYSIKISAWVFLLAGAAGFVIALATVSFQAIKSALSNPVDALRNE